MGFGILKIGYLKLCDFLKNRTFLEILIHYGLLIGLHGRSHVEIFEVVASKGHGSNVIGQAFKTDSLKKFPWAWVNSYNL